MSPESATDTEPTREPRVAAALLLVANVLFFWPVLFHGRVFSSHGAANAVYPWHADDGDPRNGLLADPASAGAPFLRRLPGRVLWNRSASGGAPGAVNVVQGFLSPFAWAPAILLPEAAVETGTLFLKFNAGFLFLFVFLRRRGMSENAAACGAAAWGWSGAQAAWWLWMQSSVTVAIPLLLLAVDRTREDRRFARCVAVSSLALALFLAGGYPFMLLFGAAAALAYGAAVLPGRPAAESRRAIGRLALSGALAAGLLLPAILVSVRTIRATGQVSARRGLAAELRLPTRHAVLFAFPLAFGDPLAGDYRPLTASRFETWVETAVGVGPAALGLTLLGAADRRNRRLWAYGSGLAAATAAILYVAPVRGFLASLPLLSGVLLERVKILAVLGVALAAAAGAEIVRRSMGRSPALARLAASLPFAVGIPLVLVAARLYPAILPKDAAFHQTPGLRRLARETAGPSRFLGTGWTLYPDLGSAFDLEDVRGHLMFEESWRRLLSAADPRIYGHTGTLLIADARTLRADSPVLDLLGVSAIAAPPGTVLAPEHLAKIYEGPDLAVYRRASAFPRFFLVDRWQPGGVGEVMEASRESLRTTAFVEEGDALRLAPPLPRAAPAGRVGVESYGNDRFRLLVEAPAPALLVSSQKLFPPYWAARLDGAPAAPIRVDGLFFGLPVPAGRHVVDARFRIPAAELAVSVVAALAILGLLAIAFRAERTR